MNILIVDGYNIMRKTMIRYFELNNYYEHIYEADTVESAKIILKKETVDVLLFDIQLPDSSGLDLVRIAQSMSPKPIIILCSNYGMRNYTNTYDYLSIDYYFDKSSELAELKKIIRRISVEHKNRAGHFRFHKNKERNGGYYEKN